MCRMETMEITIMNKRLQYTMIQDYSKCKKRLRFRFHQFFAPVNDKTIMFESFHGKRYADNPKAIYEYMLSDSTYRDFVFVWAFSDVKAHKYLENNRHTIVVKKGSRDYFRYYAGARYWINNVSVPDFLKPNRHQTYIETWHGTPLKKLGCDISTNSDPRQSAKRMHRRYRSKGKKIDYLLSPSPYYSEKLATAFDLASYHNTKALTLTGYPRNDALFHYTEEEITSIKEKLGVPEEKKVILYTPTWRDTQYQDGKGFCYTEALDVKKLMDELGDEYILLFRAHHQCGLKDIITGVDGVIDVTSADDVNDLYIISDMMITDYSSTMFDYANLHRPILFYMYDLDEYKNDIRGFYLDLDELPGPISRTQEELTSSIRDLSENFTYDKKYKAFNKKFNPYDDGNAAKRAVETCISLTPHRKSLREHFLLGFRRLRNKFRLGYMLIKYNIVGFLRRFGLCDNSNSRRLKYLKNKYKGERCFLIGNGPSLTPEDLHAIRHEYTFGTNMVYKIFDQTDWRPSFHCVSDSIYATNLGQELYDKVKSPLFTIEKTFRKMDKKPDNTTYVACLPSERYRVRGDLLSYVMVKATVLSLAAELAFHMGFKEIYLLGVDCTNPHAAGGHFIENYSSKEVAEADLSRIKTRMKSTNVSTKEIGEHIIDRSLEVYKRLNTYAKKHGIKIYNATRGGNLEIFPRVDFDSIEKK